MKTSDFTSRDRVAWGLLGSMFQDFRLLHGANFAKGFENSLNEGIKSVRAYQWPELGHISPARFKAYYQLKSFLKKYRFVNDAYTDEELRERTFEVEGAYAIRFSQPMQRTAVVHAVLQEARKIAKKVLGEFSLEELASNVRFGKRASIGCPYHQAYIDRKLTVPEHITCSSRLRGWFFNQYLPTDRLLGSIIRGAFRDKGPDRNRPDLSADVLKVVLVPKSWKIQRLITPLPLIDLFYSYGLGNMIVDRLDLIGLRIATLQNRHRRLVAQYSKNRSHATMDLSSASQSITSELCNALLPRAWYKACKPLFCHQLTVDGVATYTPSIFPMGNGATFPIETLLFYCLVKAVGNLKQRKGTYSVYGDDLIFPSSIARVVSYVFGKLNIVINDDKTFIHSHFRESCGSDYYHGIDVRPAFLPNDVGPSTGRDYEAFLYNTYNALSRRWDELELPNTFRYLKSELFYQFGRILQVPLHYPDYSGVKTSHVRMEAWPFKWSMPLIYFENGSSHFAFRHLTMKPHLRSVVSQAPNYWCAISGNDDRVSLFEHNPFRSDAEGNIFIEHPCDWWRKLPRRVAPAMALTLCRKTKKGWFVPVDVTKLSEKALEETLRSGSYCVSSKDGYSIRTTESSVSNWT